MKPVLVAGVGEHSHEIINGLKDVACEKVYLLASEGRLGEAERIKKDLEKFSLVSFIIPISGNLHEEVFKVFSEIKKSETEIIVNVGSADKAMNALLLSAVFVYGW